MMSVKSKPAANSNSTPRNAAMVFALAGALAFASPATPAFAEAQAPNANQPAPSQQQDAKKGNVSAELSKGNVITLAFIRPAGVFTLADIMNPEGIDTQKALYTDQLGDLRLTFETFEGPKGRDTRLYGGLSEGDFTYTLAAGTDNWFGAGVLMKLPEGKVGLGYDRNAVMDNLTAIYDHSFANNTANLSFKFMNSNGKGDAAQTLSTGLDYALSSNWQAGTSFAVGNGFEGMNLSPYLLYRSAEGKPNAGDFVAKLQINDAGGNPTYAVFVDIFTKV